MDLNKEIKLSELFKRPKKSGAPGPQPEPQACEVRSSRRSRRSSGSRSARRRSRHHASSTTAAKLVQLAREPLAPGIVVAGEVRDVAGARPGARRVLHGEQAAAPRHPPRHRHEPRRRPHPRCRRNRRRAPARNAVRFRAHEALSIPIDQAVLDYHVIGETVDESAASTQRVVLAAAYREPIDHYIEACRLAKLQLVGIDLEAFALLRAVAPQRRRRRRRRRTAVVALVARPRPLDARDLRRLDLRLHARARVGRRQARDGDRPRARPDRRRGRRAQASRSRSSRCGRQRRSRAVARARTPCSARFSRLRASSSPRSSSTRPSQDRLPISEILVTGGTSQLPGLVEELERLTRARVRAADPLAGVEAGQGVGDRDDLASLAVAIGLGVER